MLLIFPNSDNTYARIRLKSNTIVSALRIDFIEYRPFRSGRLAHSGRTRVNSLDIKQCPDGFPRSKERSPASEGLYCQKLLPEVRTVQLDIFGDEDGCYALREDSGYRKTEHDPRNVSLPRITDMFDALWNPGHCMKCLGLSGSCIHRLLVGHLEHQ